LLEPHLVPDHEHFADARRNPVKQDIRPAPESILWRKFPCLEAVALIKKVKRFPEIEHCISKDVER
jgi:hypothetical protein